MDRAPHDAADVGRTIPVVRLPDHRTIYLDYEGPISGNRGSVQRVARGVFEGDPTERIVVRWESGSAQEWQMGKQEVVRVQ